MFRNNKDEPQRKELTMPEAGMLGREEALRKLWCGPLCDLVVKLNGDEGPEWLMAFKRFLRREDPWRRWRPPCKFKPQFCLPLESGRRIYLALLTIEDLGLTDGVRLGEAYTRALSLGLCLCSPGLDRAICRDHTLRKRLCEAGEVIIAEDRPRQDYLNYITPVGSGSRSDEDPRFRFGDRILFVVPS